MYINQSFKQAITLPSPCIAFRITDTETDEVIASVGDGLPIEAPWEFVSESFIGEFHIWKLKASFIYFSEKKPYVNHEFYCEVGAYSHDGTNHTTINWIPNGYFKVSEDGQTTNEIAKQIDLFLYCQGTKFKNRYNC